MGIAAIRESLAGGAAFQQEDVELVAGDAAGRSGGEAAAPAVTQPLCYDA